MEYYNLNKLIKISALEAEKSEMYYWQDYRSDKKRWINGEWHGELKEGFYGWDKGILVYYNEVPENHFVKNKEVFLKDRVVLEFEGDITKVVYCDNSDHADKFTKDILSKKFNSVLISPRNTILY